MKNKYIICMSVTLLGYLGINYTSNATLKTKFIDKLNFLMSKGIYSVTSHIDIDSKFKTQVQEMISKGEIIGASAKELNFSGLKELVFANYYYQNVDDNGQLVTLISTKIPKVKGIEENKVTVKYLTPDGEKATVITNGFPRWIPGLSINNAFKKKQKDTKTTVQSTSKLLSHIEEENPSYSGAYLGKATPGSAVAAIQKKLSIKKSSNNTKVLKRHSTNDDLSYLGAAAPLQTTNFDSDEETTNLID